MANMTNLRRFNEHGVINAWQVATIGLGILVLGLGSFGIWAFVAYNDASSDLEGKIKVAESKAREVKGVEDEEKFAEREKQPNSTYTAPDDYCALTFKYPKTWSGFESEQPANGGDFKAYFNPKIVPPISNSQQYSLRVVIEQKDFDDVVAAYDSLVLKGDLKQSIASSEGHQYTRLTGNFSKNIRGDAVIYRCRDKAITIRTDADAFKTDFEAIIRTVDYNE